MKKTNIKMNIAEKNDYIGRLRYCRAEAKRCQDKKHTKNWARNINKLERMIANAEIIENWVTEWIESDPIGYILRNY